MSTQTLERRIAEALSDPLLPPVVVRETIAPTPELFLPITSRPVPSALQERVAKITETGPPLSFIGYAPLVARPVVLATSKAVVMPLALDPHFQARALGMPRKVRRQVRRHVRSGPEFHTFYIAHELTDMAFQMVLRRPDLLLADLGQVVGPPKTDRRAERIVEGTNVMAHYGAIGIAAGVLVPTVFLAAVAAAATAVAAGVAIAPVIALGALLASPASGLDPALFGVVTATGNFSVGEPAAFFHIASWR